jgi:hypothetical protein
MRRYPILGTLAGGLSAWPFPYTHSRSGMVSMQECVGCRFDIRFMQDVRAEDMYLGVNRVKSCAACSRVALCCHVHALAGSSEKDPSSTSCDRVVVHVKLPGANVAQVDLSVTKQRITVQSPD